MDIIIDIRGGMPDVYKKSPGVRLIIRDFDVEGLDEDELEGLPTAEDWFDKPYILHDYEEDYEVVPTLV